MSDRAFLDSNIFIYSYDNREPIKQSIASDLIRSLVVAQEATISYQVIQAFFNWALVKDPVKMPKDDAQLYLNTTFRPLHIVPPSSALISDAIGIQERYRLSWYDSLIVSAAQHTTFRPLHSEDLQHEQQFDTVKVCNPFR